MNEKEEFLQKLSKMSVEELMKYESAANTTKTLVGIIAVMLILLTLFNPNVFMIIATSIFVYIMANLSVGIGEFLKVVRGHLESRR